jgi:hypothetical protein
MPNLYVECKESLTQLIEKSRSNRMDFAQSFASISKTKFYTFKEIQKKKAPQKGVFEEDRT